MSSSPIRSVVDLFKSRALRLADAESFEYQRESIWAYEDELRRIFHWYHLFSPLSDPIITLGKLYELARDCELIGGGLQYGDVSVDFYEAKPKSLPGGAGFGLEFDPFVHLLVQLAFRRYNTDEQPVDALIQRHLIPLAGAIDEVAGDTSVLALLSDPKWRQEEEILEHPRFVGMFDPVRNGLLKAFQHYSRVEHRKAERQQPWNVTHRAQETLSFDEFVRFCRHYELFPSLLSLQQLWRIFHLCNGRTDWRDDSGMDVLDFEQFMHALRRCCLAAYQSDTHPHLDTYEKRMHSFIRMLSLAYKKMFGVPLEHVPRAMQPRPVSATSSPMKQPQQQQRPQARTPQPLYLSALQSRDLAPKPHSARSSRLLSGRNSVSNAYAALSPLNQSSPSTRSRSRSRSASPQRGGRSPFYAEPDELPTPVVLRTDFDAYNTTHTEDALDVNSSFVSHSSAHSHSHSQRALSPWEQRAAEHLQQHAAQERAHSDHISQMRSFLAHTPQTLHDRVFDRQLELSASRSPVLQAPRGSPLLAATAVRAGTLSPGRVTPVYVPRA